MGMNKLAVCLLFGFVVTTHGQGVAADPELLASIREGDASRVEGLLRSGIDPNTRNESGATALMYAAAFASAETMRLLLNAGADVNVANQSGATALMWATHDPAKVRLLVDRGADVNEVRRDGVTPLLSAALRGKTEVMRTLIAAGADARKGSAPAPGNMRLPQIALSTSDPAMRELLDTAEATPQTLAQWAPPPLTNWLLTSVFSWRPQPASTSAGLVRALDAGANPNETVAQMALVVPALSRVARLGDLEAMRVLLERGADPTNTTHRRFAYTPRPSVWRT